VYPETIDEDIRIRVMEKKLVAMDLSDIREILKAIISGIGKREQDDS
jgi:hypothetical protein